MNRLNIYFGGVSMETTYIFEILGFDSIYLYSKSHQSEYGIKYMYRDVPKLFGHCNYLLYISYKTTIFENIIPKSILVRF
jgi:hypothetical protein